MTDEKNFLGTGWSFPPTFTKQGKNSVELVSGEEDIKQSLQVILNTAIDERIMRPDFGADMNTVVFESVNESFLTYIKDKIKTSLLLYEPRIEVDTISADLDQDRDGVLIIEVDYQVRATNSRGNIVFPFYLNEGTDIV